MLDTTQVSTAIAAMICTGTTGRQLLTAIIDSIPRPEFDRVVSGPAGGASPDRAEGPEATLNPRNLRRSRITT